MITHSLVLARRLGLTLLAPLGLAGLSIALGAAYAAAPARAMQIDNTPATRGALRSSETITTYVYLPLIARSDPCGPIPDAVFETIGPIELGSDPAGDNLINLGLRGYEPVDEYKGLVDTASSGDPNAPQFPGLFADQRTPDFRTVYAIHKGDGSGRPITNPAVTLAGLATAPGETIHLPDSGYDIGGFDAMVLYAEETRLTLKYTREDNIVYGYTLYLENVCVDPNLLALYAR